MGSDAQAKFIYGFPVGGEGFNNDNIEPLDDNFIAKLEDLFVAKHGVVEPAGKYENNKDAFKEYWTKRRNFVKQNMKATIEYEGDLCNSVGTDYLCHVDSVTRMDWESPTEITPEIVTAKANWRQELLDFCILMGITWQEPKMLCICSYG